MSRKLLVFFVFSLACVYVDSTFELRLPTVAPLSNFVNRITNTTFGLVRGGFSFFGRTVDRIINTFNGVEDRLKELLEEFRKQIIRGIPELNIPILDPLHIDNIQFEVVHETGDFNGSASDVTVRHISKFVVSDAKFEDLGRWNFKIDLNLTFPFIRVDGNYDVNAVIGDMFGVFGKGKFWLNLYDLQLSIGTIITFELTRLRITSLSLGVKLNKLENHFENLMNDTRAGEVYNKVISRLAPEAIDMMWPELRSPIEKQVMRHINRILENASVSNLARRLFNIID